MITINVHCGDSSANCAYCGVRHNLYGKSGKIYIDENNTLDPSFDNGIPVYLVVLDKNYTCECGYVISEIVSPAENINIEE